MTEKRFEIYDEENGYIRDNKTGESYSACGGGDGFPFVIDEYHKLQKENEQLKKLLECSREEANDYCEELMCKDEFIRLYKRQRDEVIEENEQLKKENNKIKTLLFQKIKELNDAYQKSAKAGMPTGGIIGELDSFEEICEEMGWLK